tara:strand:+ start:202 stop:1473 length:1272 start_codon:yes stop_codon:yes gene_type:complete
MGGAHFSHNFSKMPSSPSKAPPGMRMPNNPGMDSMGKSSVGGGMNSPRMLGSGVGTGLGGLGAGGGLGLGGNSGQSNESKAPFDLTDFPSLSSTVAPGSEGYSEKERIANSRLQDEFSLGKEDFPALPGQKSGGGGGKMGNGGNGSSQEEDYSMNSNRYHSSMSMQHPQQSLQHPHLQQHQSQQKMSQDPFAPAETSGGGQPSMQMRGQSGGGGGYNSYDQSFPQLPQQQGGYMPHHEQQGIGRGQEVDLSGENHGGDSHLQHQRLGGGVLAGSSGTSPRGYHNSSEEGLGMENIVGGSSSFSGTPDASLTYSQRPQEKFGLLGLLGVIRMTNNDLNTLALGLDLTTLGLNLNSPVCLYNNFSSPFDDKPVASEGDQVVVPRSFLFTMPDASSKFTQFSVEALMYIFYNMPKDALQIYAAHEL